jgi:uncharacterized protein (DUF2141 family)
MKKIILYSLFVSYLVFILTTTASATDNERGLVINVKNIKKAQGSILVAIYTNEQNYMKTPAYSQIIPVSAIGDLAITSTIPFGSYSITLFHDVNDNRNLDTNFLGIPKEPYGFSNDAKAPFGPPSFDAATVSFQEVGDRVEVTLR